MSDEISILRPKLTRRKLRYGLPTATVVRTHTATQDVVLLVLDAKNETDGWALDRVEVLLFSRLLAKLAESMPEPVYKAARPDTESTE